jgi:ferredoxin-thioredoxin reductase catalytic subunit/rubredoxin
MKEKIVIPQEDINRLYEKLDREAGSNGYHLNPEIEFTKGLVESLLVNEKRYGYWNCPCRLSSGIKEKDLDIICPCDYRDADLLEYDACYCALYVSTRVKNGEIKAHSIPERRPPAGEREKQKLQEKAVEAYKTLSYPVWRCKVCGYLCARDNPPEICPVCKAKKDRFERFM